MVRRYAAVPCGPLHRPDRDRVERAAFAGRALLPPRGAAQCPRRRQRLTAVGSAGGAPHLGAPFCWSICCPLPTTAGTSAVATRPPPQLHVPGLPPSRRSLKTQQYREKSLTRALLPSLERGTQAGIQPRSGPRRG